MRSCIKKMIHIAIVYQKNDTYCNMYQNMYYIFCTWYNMYQKNDTRNYTLMDRSYKNNGQNGTPNDTRSKILIHHSVHQIDL